MELSLRNVRLWAERQMHGACCQTDFNEVGDQFWKNLPSILPSREVVFWSTAAFSTPQMLGRKTPTKPTIRATQRFHDSSSPFIRPRHLDVAASRDSLG